MTHQMPDGGIDRTIAVVDFGASSTTFSVLRNLKVDLHARISPSVANSSPKKSCVPTVCRWRKRAAPRRRRSAGQLPVRRCSIPFIDDMTQQGQPARCSSISLPVPGASSRKKILVCGGCANFIPGVADVISSRSRASPPKRGDPLGQMKICLPVPRRRLCNAMLALLTACGLALQSFD